MARQLSLVSATLITAAVSGLMPSVADHFSSPPPPPATIIPAPAMPSTAPTATMPAAVAAVSRTNGNLPASTSPDVLEGGIKFLNPDASSRLAFRVQDATKDRRQRVHPLLQNTTDAEKTVAINLFAQDRTGGEVTCKLDSASSSFFLKAREVKFHRMWLQSCEEVEESARKLGYPLTGVAQLTVTTLENVQVKSGKGANASNPAAKSGPTKKVKAKTNKDAKTSAGTSKPEIALIPFSVSEPPPEGNAATLAFLIPLALAVTVVLITIVSLKCKKIPLRNRMGNATWSFAQSWGANIAIASGLTGAFLTATIFPDHPQFMSRESYTMLQTLFTVMIALAPFVYALIRHNVTTISNGVLSTDAQGYVFIFLISGGLVLWSALGQVAILGLLLLDFINSRSLPAGVGNTLLALAALLGIFLIIYGLRSLYQTAKNLSVSAATVTSPPLPFPAAEGTLLSPEEAKSLKAPLRAWAVL